jgi:hypothetical protein
MKTLATTMLSFFCLAPFLSCVEASHLRHTAGQINGPDYLQKLFEAGKQWINEDVEAEMALRANLASKKTSNEVAATSEAPKLPLEEVRLSRKAVTSMNVATIRNKICSSFGQDGTLKTDTAEKLSAQCKTFCGLDEGKVGAYIVETPANADAHCYCSTLDDCQKTILCPDCTVYSIGVQLSEKATPPASTPEAPEAIPPASTPETPEATPPASTPEAPEATPPASTPETPEVQLSEKASEARQAKTNVQERIEAFTKDPEGAKEALKQDSEASMKGLQEAVQAVQKEREASASVSEEAASVVSKADGVATTAPGMVKLATVKEGATVGLSCSAYDQEILMTLDTDSKMAEACRSACDLESTGKSGVYAVQKMDGKAMCSCASLDKCGSLKDVSSVTTYVVKA